MMDPMRRWAVGAGALLLATLPAAAQQGREEPAAPSEERTFEERIEVGEVLLDVLVTDRDGNVVVGLGPGDFVVREDGEAVPVDSATFYSSARLAESSQSLEAKGLAVDPVPEDRYFILLFDDVRKFTGPGTPNLLQEQMQAGRDAGKWVAEDLAPADWVAVASYDRSLELHQDFTRDRQAIRRAIDRAVTGRDAPGRWPSRRDEAADDDGPALADDLPQGKAMVKASPRIYDALRLLAEGSTDLRGRKNLVYFGLGFGDIDSFGLYREDTRYYPDMVAALNDANVAAYTLDLAPDGAHHGLEGALSQLALDTGGRSFLSPSGFAIPLREIAEENTGYYLLSYRAGHPRGEEGFQRVEVEARDPALEVRARRGYLYGADDGAG